MFLLYPRWSVLYGLLCVLVAYPAYAQINESVGAAAANRREDVLQMQRLLNAVPDLSGGPKQRLDEDGKVGPQTLAAIKRFQRMQLGFEDGRVDPQGKTELRLMRLAGKHVLLGGADTEVEKQMAELTSAFASIAVSVDGKTVFVRPPYHINAGRRKANAEANRKANPAIRKLLYNAPGSVEVANGKATPDQMRHVLQAAIDADLVSPLTPQGIRDFLATYGISTDCSGLAARACNQLYPDAPLDVVNKANTAYLAKLPSVASPADLKAGHMMVKGGSHVRLLTDVDVTPEGIEFTTLESTASKLFPNGDGIGERRWRFPDPERFDQLQEMKGNRFVEASSYDQAYIYTSRK
ncbi:peptidoglycan-binding domain-containing protein [Roseimaritima ulvae]|uniref:Peptidoglycan binding domain protein n=1 Tax=Roseimaritima ulvae TaxID=980254 RepID=A0A5B9QGK7_9BACT|nr:peptidoglycan-binding domain-containing protein [Roseimaritima ulvae]QEG38168.1 Putative peptidoglycan binding domain protein [Roseimaritima ulvae]